MRTAGVKFVLLIVCLAGFGLIIAHQRRNADEMKNEIVRLTRENSFRADRERARKTADQDRARAEFDILRAAQIEAETLRREITRLRASDVSASETEASGNPEARLKAWTNAGNATPAATFETVLWSTLNGDTDTLANLIAFEPASRAQLEVLFARLPEAQRESSGSLEKVFAILLAARLPQNLSAADVITNSENPGNAKLRLHLAYVNGSGKDATFNFNRTPAGWRLIIPPRIVENYQQMLASAPK